MIQIPEMALYWFGQAKKQLWNESLSESNSTVKLKRSKINDGSMSNMQVQTFPDRVTCIKIGSQPDNLRRTTKEDKTHASMEQWNIMSARMDHIESRLHILDDFESKLQRLDEFDSKLQRLTFMI